MLTKDDEDAESIRLVKARLDHLFKHELEAFQHKYVLITLYRYAMKRFYRMWKCCSGLGLDDGCFLGFFDWSEGLVSDGIDGYFVLVGSLSLGWLGLKGFSLA